MKIAVFSEGLAPPPDEGIKNFSLNLARALRRLGNSVLLMTAHGSDWLEMGVTNIPANRLLHSPELKKHLTAFDPEAIIYVPTASLTLGSALRCSRLKSLGGGIPVILVALQGRKHGQLTRLAARFFSPDLCICLSQQTEKQAQALSWRTACVSPGVCHDVFKPVSPEEKLALRNSFGVPSQSFVVLHVGHPIAQRGIDIMAKIADWAYPLFVVSPNPFPDQKLIERLRRAGAHILSGYVPDIHKVYQLSDLYLFPVPPNPTDPSSIDFPLSVLEALACNVPVLATRFGALTEFWPGSPGISFFDNPEELPSLLVRLKEQKVDVTGLVAGLSWEMTGQRFLDLISPVMVPLGQDEREKRKSRTTK